MNHEIRLESRGDALYLGMVHLGYPHTQPVKVAFDTGSEFLAVTSSLCDDLSAPPGFGFQKIDEKTKQNLDRTEPMKTGRCQSMAYHL
jgi:hypothetical protein